jgi:hypothetical protein
MSSQYDGHPYERKLKAGYDSSKLSIKKDLHHWRTNDLEDNFKRCDVGAKGYLNSKEQRRMLTDSGITMMTTFGTIKQSKFMNLNQISETIEEMLPQDVVVERARALFRWHDRKESDDGRLTGFVNQSTVEANLEEHGLSEDEIAIFISPYTRNDHKIEYSRLLEVLYPKDIIPRGSVKSTAGRGVVDAIEAA